ncbi:FGGY-family carbohydrate kinase [Geomicrobium sp. JCM 19037]|uniref:FGGY-family carbohydrate kinase n=1 Tax=Geomicrobium sp. JCM 19037 TaxID=1460634 RepID=UPI00210140F5|nr:FGGY-family carbohydrate kinase [Geomicrobium sp. JCM 19037]
MLEGVVMSLRQTMEQLIGPVDRDAPIVLIGGGTSSGAWCQMAADVWGVSVHVPEQAEYLPAMGAASLGFVHLGWCENLETFNERVIKHRPKHVYDPCSAATQIYEQRYGKFLQLYVKDE